MEDFQTCQEAGERLKISHATVKKYLDNFFPGDPLRDSNGRRILTKEQFATIEMVCTYRQQGKSLADIKRLLPRFDDSTTATQPERDRVSDETRVPGPDIREIIRAEITGAIQANNDMALALSQATYKVGQLEERVVGLSDKLDGALQLVTDSNQERDDARLQIADLQQRLAAAHERINIHEGGSTGSWWRRLFKRVD